MTTNTIFDYWNTKPPFKAKEASAEGTLEWYNSISQHRYEVVPYIYDWAAFDAFADQDVLEIGCGAGTDLSEFARHRARVTGVDITDTAVELSTRRLQVEGLTGSVVKYAGNRLPFADESFDLVYSCGVLHHTPHMDDLFSEAHRVLRKGGRLKLMLYNRHSLLYYYSILYLRMVQGGMHDEGREEVLSKYSEFRTGCPYTRCLTEGEAKDRLWFFEQVETSTDYCVYDTETERKLPGARYFDVPQTGIADIDAFFSKFNRAVSEGADLRAFGWHLLVDARK